MSGKIWTLTRDTVNEFINDDCSTMAAALSYYTVFSLPPLLYLVIRLTGLLFDPSDIEGQVEKQIGNLIGSKGTEAVKSMLENANSSPGSGSVGTILGLAAILLGASGAFIQLQSALNRAWGVKPDPAQGGFRNFVSKRILGFSLILVLAFLLLVSLVVSAAVSAFGDYLVRLSPDAISGPLLQVFNIGVSLVVIGLLLAAIFKFLPDAILEWRDIWVGAAITAVLFVLGKTLIGLYLGNSNPVSAYGAAASLAIVFVWVYYSSMIILFGAEFTQVWAHRYGTEIRPEANAVRVLREYRHERPGPEPKSRERDDRAI